METEMVNQVAQYRGQYSSTFHIAEEVKAENCGTISGGGLVSDVCLCRGGVEVHGNADDNQYGRGAKAVR